jgi:hypothetical protein
MTNQTTNNQSILLFNLAHRILNEELAILNSAAKASIGIKLLYAKEKHLFVRHYSRDKKKIIRLAEWITLKKLSEINFSENQIDQLKVRIVLRKFMMKLILRVALLRINSLLAIINNNPIGFFRFIRAR